MGNPFLRGSVFKSYSRSNEVMKVSGVINKSIILWFLLAGSAFYSWTHPGVIMPLVVPISVGAFVLAMISTFKMQTSPFLAPIYAICEGFILGAVSLHFEKVYPGVVVNAILLTVCVLFCMLAAYKAGILRATPKFQKVVTLSMFAICFVYIINLFLNMFGVGNFPYIHNYSVFGIAISFVVVAVASLTLIIDFDLIERGACNGAPEYMEWYAAFSLMVTLVWLYVEMLDFLLKLKKR
ncbi:membrane protein [Endomicrobiia bacterium]|nr:membrane protein [Endomicrobiia bacterium]GHT69842.1 membrane protein [Endomicrobiia bacterium]GHT74697.1 membrane protein [Endomicrobiia bacterium]